MHLARQMQNLIEGRLITKCNPVDLIHSLADKVTIVVTRTGIWDIIFPDRSEIQFAQFGAVWSTLGVYEKPVDVQ